MQRSFDDMGTPLSDVTFCVLDIETTGGAGDDAITEIGAIKLRGGESIGTFQTLVNPGVPIPPTITYLTGITEAMVMPAPAIESVIGAFNDFVGGSVIVGHNVRFDLRFLNNALQDYGYDAFGNTFLDTCSLARRLVRDEVPNCKLHTLAQFFRLGHKPTHRALDDAIATGELLHCLLERAGTMGVTSLEDALALPTIGSHPQIGKLTLTDKLPRVPGVYKFKNAIDEVLYVGKATNIRQRVRSYFNGDDRRKIGRLLQEVTSIETETTANEFEATVREVRLIHEHEPHYNYQVKNWRKYAFVSLTLEEKYPRLIVAKNAHLREDRFHIGPLSSKTQAQIVVEALQTVTRLRRCTKVPTGRRPVSPCLAAQLGKVDCPCTGNVDFETYSGVVSDLITDLSTNPNVFIDRLREKMLELAKAERFEEAAEMRDRADTLARILIRQAQIGAIQRVGRLVFRASDRSIVELQHGKVVSVSMDGAISLDSHQCDEQCPTDASIRAETLDELLCVTRFIERQHLGLEIIDQSSEFVWPTDAVERVKPEASKPEHRRLPNRYASAVA